ncbi:SanA/YdcF family protein [Kaistella carnis]|uniref:SanA/YdcF family protein n=1 Tax=Kaistella carnis TaxID=1241979 RepID=UPI00289831C2|nr:ElyC/SanA/YdcF family protein [Kaistella carnis]
MRFFKNTLKIVLVLLALGFIFIVWANHTIEYNTEDYVTENISKLPSEKVGLVLGTSKTLKNGGKNPYFYYRMDAAEELYKSGKITYIIVSGDNSTKDYNEPEDMQTVLVERGIPKSKIFLDFAGLRTLDSVVRAKEIFGQKSYIIISQRFHNERAVFLAQKKGITAYGYNAKDVDKKAGLTTNLREYLARVKVFWDLFFGVDPKFGGSKVVIL